MSTAKSIPAIVLGQSPERDRDIDSVITTIQNCAKAGIRTLKYNMSILGVVRSGTVPGRGDTQYNKWNYKEALAQNKPQTRPAMSARASSGTASNISCPRSCPPPTSTRCASPAIRRIRACRRKAIWASTMCWARPTA